MPLKLDRSRDFSTVHVSHDPERPPEVLPAFVQDGWPFDAQGEIMEELLSKEQKPKYEQVQKRDAERAKKGAAKEKDDPKIDPNEVNLTAWAKGEVKYPPHVISRAIRDRYSANVTTIPDMIEFLVKEGAIKDEELAEQFRPKE